MEQREIISKIATVLEEYLSSSKETGFLKFKKPEELREILRLKDFQDGADWPQIFWWIEKYLEYSVRTNHPNFVNRMWAGANLPSIAGEIIAAVSNTSSCTFESAPVSTVMEKYMINEMLELVGFKHGEGQMTTGSSNANMLAMMSARNEMLPEVKINGLSGVRGGADIYAFVSADAHYSMEKAANILGLGTKRLIKIPVTNTGEMDIAILARQLKELSAKGGSPFFVGATAGTTVRGAYDSLEELLELRQQYPFWLYVDGAWGGAAVISETLRRNYLAGIEEVDSFTWDFHKMLGTALMCNVFLINKRTHTLGKVCSAGDDSYIFHGENDNDVLDPGAVSLQSNGIVRINSKSEYLAFDPHVRQKNMPYIVQQTASGRIEFEIYYPHSPESPDDFAVLSITQVVNTSGVQHPINSIHNSNTAYLEITSTFSAQELQDIWNSLKAIGNFRMARVCLKADSKEDMLQGIFQIVEINLFLPMPLVLLAKNVREEKKQQLTQAIMLVAARLVKTIPRNETGKSIFFRKMKAHHRSLQ